MSKRRIALGRQENLVVQKPCRFLKLTGYYRQGKTFDNTCAFRGKIP